MNVSSSHCPTPERAVYPPATDCLSVPPGDWVDFLCSSGRVTVPCKNLIYLPTYWKILVLLVLSVGKAGTTGKWFLGLRSLWGDEI